MGRQSVFFSPEFNSVTLFVDSISYLRPPNVTARMSRAATISLLVISSSMINDT